MSSAPGWYVQMASNSILANFRRGYNFWKCSNIRRFSNIWNDQGWKVRLPIAPHRQVLWTSRTGAGGTFISTVIIIGLAVLVIKITINVLIIITIVIIIKPDLLNNQGCTIFWLLLSSPSWTWGVSSSLASGEYFIIIIVVIVIVIAIVIIIIIPWLQVEVVFRPEASDGLLLYNGDRNDGEIFLPGVCDDEDDDIFQRRVTNHIVVLNNWLNMMMVVMGMGMEIMIRG